MKRKNLRFLMLLAVLAAVLIGCTNGADFSGQEETMQMDKELTQRQIAILEEMGLPTDYNQLDVGQQSAIHAIETLLVHLEQTYGEEFAYLGYVVGGGVEREHLIAYPVSGSKTDRVTLYRWVENGQILFRDNYPCVKALPCFEDAAAALIGEYVEPAHSSFFCKIYDVKGEVTPENAAKNVSATVYLFVDGDFVSEEACLKLGEGCRQWLEDNHNGMSSSVLLMRTNTGEFYGITADNYESKIWHKIFSIRTEYIISTDGELRILE